MLSTLSSTAWPLPTFCTSSTSRMMLPPSLIWLRVLIRLVVMSSRLRPVAIRSLVALGVQGVLAEATWAWPGCPGWVVR